jgi:hypothetical protein
MAQHVFDFTARLQADPASIARTAATLRGVTRGLSGSVAVNTSGAVAGLAKVGTAASSAQAALRATQAQANALNATLHATVSVTNTGASSLGNFGNQAGLAARRFLAFSVAAGGMVKAVQGIKEGVRGGRVRAVDEQGRAGVHGHARPDCGASFDHRRSGDLVGCVFRRAGRNLGHAEAGRLLHQADAGRP